MFDFYKYLPETRVGAFSTSVTVAVFPLGAGGAVMVFVVGSVSIKKLESNKGYENKTFT